MKRIFEAPEMALVEFAVEDVITTSADIELGENETEGGGGL